MLPDEHLLGAMDLQAQSPLTSSFDLIRIRVVGSVPRVARAAVVGMRWIRAQRSAFARCRFARCDYALRCTSGFNPIDNGTQHVELIKGTRAASAMAHARH